MVELNRISDELLSKFEEFKDSDSDQEDYDILNYSEYSEISDPDLN